jgi:uncharacterized protein
MNTDWYRWQDDVLILNCYIKPRARNDEVLGLHDGRLHVQVQAPPVSGKANTALCAFLARSFGVSQSCSELRAGAGNRRKTVAIHKPAAEPAWFNALRQA